MATAPQNYGDGDKKRNVSKRTKVNLAGSQQMENDDTNC